MINILDHFEQLETTTKLEYGMAIGCSECAAFLIWADHPQAATIIVCDQPVFCSKDCQEKNERTS